MEGGGFEPPKATPTDLQSVPFGHSGTPPREHPAGFHVTGEAPASQAGEGTRTPNPLITNEMLYQIELRQQLGTGAVAQDNKGRWSVKLSAPRARRGASGRTAYLASVLTYARTEWIW